ncbi:MAG: DsrE family protein [Ferruginibacter sp.]
MRYKAIIQLMSGDDAVIKSTASQINNLQKALNNEVDIELVCHGQSLPFVLNESEKWTIIIRQLLSADVDIVVCENMLKANGKLKTDLFPGINTIPAGIAEIVIKQQQGWSYVKAGF